MKKKSLLILPTLLLMLFQIQASSANYSVYASFNDAYYADLDADGVADDIMLDMTIEVYNNYVFTDIDLYISITLPSGLEHWFLLEFTVQKSTYGGYVNLAFETYNTATEQGWYDASAVGFATGEQFSIMETITFDPPGGTIPGEPVSYSATFY